MSGIAGLWCLDDRPAGSEDLARMVAWLLHRGPDGRGLWLEGPVGLGQLCLHTSAGPPEPAPVVSEDGQLCVVADARIDNGPDLLPRLEARGLRPRTSSDAELILRAYQAWGEDCARELLGDFAFAVWDGRQRQVVAACDPLGIKPFYYSNFGTTFRFASEPGALFADGRTQRRPNLGLACRYLLKDFREREETLDEGVYRLPGAHVLCVRPGQARKVRYWDVDPERKVHCRDDQEYADRFLDLFRSSVGARLRSAGPPGVLLSGGLDSSSIAATARALHRSGKVADNGLRAFSLVFDGHACDERVFIQEVARHCDLPLHIHASGPDCDSLDLARGRELPEVYYLPTLWMLGPLYQAARKAGTNVVLTGIGGDDLLAASLDHLTDLARQGRFGQMLWQLGHDARATGASWPKLLLDYCLRPLLPASAKAVARPLYRRLRPAKGSRLPAWLNVDGLRKFGATERLESPPVGPRFPTRSQQRIYDWLVAGWNMTVALGAGERFASRLGVDVRHPFLDRKLVEFLLAVPEEQRWHGRWPKAVLRRAMRGILPELVRKRTDKAEFSAIINGSWRARQAAALASLLRRPALADLGIIHADRFQRFFQETVQDPQSPQHSVECEIVLWLELWFRSIAGVQTE